MNTQDSICPICGEGLLEARVDKNPVEYKGHSVELDVQYSVCDSCGSEQADAVQTRQNKRAMLAFKKTVDSLLTGAEIRLLRSRLGISQSQAAAIFGGGPVAFSKYESDDVAQSEAMDKLLRLADALPVAFKFLAQSAGVQLASQSAQIGGLHNYVPSNFGTETDNPNVPRPQLKVVHSSTIQECVHYEKAA